MSEPMIYNTALARGIYGEKALGISPVYLKQGHLKALRVKDEQEFIRSGTWYNLPSGLSSDLIERILYYKGEGMMFYVKELDQFFFLPYVQEGDFDVYGRYVAVRPMPFTGDSETKNKNKTSYISTFVRNTVYDIKLPEELKLDDYYNDCVLLHDYSQQLSQHTISRKELQEPILNQMAELYPFLRTRLINDTGVRGMKVANSNDQQNVIEASRSLVTAALEGDMYVPIIGSIEFQELTSGNGGVAAQEYLMAYQSLDNLRKANLGIASSGTFEKAAHTLQSEQAMNASSIDLVLQDKITLRQEFCNIVNSIWGLGIWYEPSETLVMADLNGDGVDYNRDANQNISQEENNEGEDNATN